ncbi:hypothetical protein CKM354_000267100 [Cercospora kikuchii]|uniref:Rhodopsin domain-containing protein n=1 Tax=Cercospora kikuchii TaxID=84275 RepID=A0A9P3C9R5_9PEZI|nr:uncharacterized protein CKM354_000267100 [Cercospora kikuchii]GIZ39282.1 hypothetical protein CKM354_000267100 [Cercospora kikuchii]
MSSTSHVISQNEAFLASWICAALALTILVARLLTHQHRHRAWDTITAIIICSIAILVARTVLNALILRLVNSPSIDDDNTLRTSSILVLAARVVVTAYYWLQCVILLLFYREMLNHISWIHQVIKVCWVVIGTTFLAVILATFLECRPINHYWTTSPDGPHQCTRAYVQILLQCVSNLVIDGLLLLIATPILKAQAKVFPRNLQLGFLYILGTFSIILIALKIHFIFKDGSVQHARSFWASVQVVVCTFVANAPSIYGAVKNVKRRRSSVMSLARIRTNESNYFEMPGPPPKPPVLKIPKWADNPRSKSASPRIGEP